MSNSPTDSVVSESDSGGEDDDRYTVLVVDDEREVADLYAMKLRTDYNAWTAYNGSQALDIIDGTVDVVLLDRRMPGMSGDEVLTKIKERGLDCQIAMVTAVEPEFEIIGMGFDDYVVKPVTEHELHETVENLLRRREYESRVREYMSLGSKRSVLESKMDEDELSESEEYRELVNEMDALKKELEEDFGDDEEIEDLKQELEELESDFATTNLSDL